MKNSAKHTFVDINHYKSQSRYYPIGSIVPRCLMKITKQKTGKMVKNRHAVIFSSNAWVKFHHDRFLVLCETGKNGSAITMKEDLGKVVASCHLAKNGSFYVGTHDGDMRALELLNEFASVEAPEHKPIRV